MIGLIRSRGRSVVRSRLVVSGSGLRVSRGRLMVSRGGFGGAGMGINCVWPIAIHGPTLRRDR